VKSTSDAQDSLSSGQISGNRVLESAPSSQPHLSHPKYRPDIDGLRAIAVLSVVGFHAFPRWIKGGFIGVDVFFVISGFLISTIIFENLDRGTFSFAAFYARRIKRIFPSLFTVLTASSILGWFALFADEYKQLGKHIAGGAVFISNFVLWHESGYFDNSADTKPMLHLWSLGIEEQFYLVWPLALWLAWKSRINLLTLTVLVACISAYLNVTTVSSDLVAAFYSPQTRFWELLSGSLLAWVCTYKRGAYEDIKTKLNSWLAAFVRMSSDTDGKVLANLLSTAGLLLLVYGFWRLNKDMQFPGFWAVIPVLGALLLISAGPLAWINSVILSNRIAVWFGLISFPLYLWHWPLLSFARVVRSEVPSSSIRVAAVAVSIVLAWLTYKAIERPIRFGGQGKLKVTLLVILMGAVGSLGWRILKRDGLPYRTEDREAFLNYFENSYPRWQYYKRANLTAVWRDGCAFFNSRKYFNEGRLEGGSTNSKPLSHIDTACYLRDSRFQKSVFIWGDSHAQALTPGIVDSLPKDWQVLQVASSGCPPNPNVEVPSTTSQCEQSNYFAIKTIREAKPDVVVVAEVSGHSAKTMQEIAAKVEPLGVKKILFLGPTPQWTTDLPRIMARQLWLTKPRRTHVGLDQQTLSTNRQLLKEFKATEKSEFVDVIGVFCNGDGCLTYTRDDMRESLTTWDYGHLTPSGSDYLAKNRLAALIMGN
jgi:peptidoglycan/LPS O-acetylase OafA/YrhL